MSLQGETVIRHVTHYLEEVDPALGVLFTLTLVRAGYPEVSAASALEAICADFLAGAARHDATPPEEAP